MKIFLKYFLALLFMTTFFSKGFSQKKELFYGSWTFDKIEETAETRPADKPRILQSTKASQGMIWTFSSDGKVNSRSSKNLAHQKFDGVFRYYPDKQNLAIEVPEFLDLYKVIRLSQSEMVLFHKDLKVNLLFKKQAK